MPRIQLILIATLTAVLVAGCDVQFDRPIASNPHRERLLIADRPADATTIESARTELAESTGAEVTVKGQVDLDAYETIARGKALILVREIIDDDHGDESGHDPSTCPFCKRRLEAAAKAAVEFVDDKGNVLPISADKLFGLAQWDKVIVQGTAQVDRDLDMLKITASGIHLLD